MITHVVGDLLASDEKVIAHGCNTQGVMGAGIALAVASRYPEVERTYRAACKFRDFQVGTAQEVVLPDEGVTVFNLGTQEFPGRNATYWAVTLSFGNMFERCRVTGVKRVGIPRIGCGIGGLDWSAVEWVLNGIINEWVPNAPEVVVYTHPKEAYKWTT